MDTVIQRSSAARKPVVKAAKKKPSAKSTPRKKQDTPTRRFLDAIMGLKL